MTNPFKYGCVVAGENFCARPDLQNQLQKLLKSGQNVVVQGPRRMGKTSLVCETVNGMKGMHLLYVDLFCVRTVAELCRRMVAAAVKCGSGHSFAERVAGLIKGLRPVFTIDKDTGLPSMSIDMKAAKDVSSVEEVMDMLGKLATREKLCIVLDEFQDVLDVPDSDVLIARLRGMIQFMSEVPFVFLGSIRNEMHEIFDSPKSPFYKSAISFSVDEIDPETFSAFIVRRFEAGHRKISSDMARRIIDMAAGITGDVQELSETTWLVTSEKDVIGEKEIQEGLAAVLRRESRSFAEKQSRLTTVQWSVLVGLAAEHESGIYSGEFLERWGLKSVSSVTKAIKRLVQEEVIYSYEGDYRFENPFFRQWILKTAQK